MTEEKETGFRKARDKEGKIITIVFKSVDAGQKVPRMTATHIAAFLPLNSAGDRVRVVNVPSIGDATNLVGYMQDNLRAYKQGDGFKGSKYRHEVTEDDTYTLRRVR